MKIPEELLNKVKRHERNKEDNICLILTCAHNLCTYSSEDDKTIIANESRIIFGKQQN